MSDNQQSLSSIQTHPARSKIAKVSVLLAPAGQVQEQVREAMELADWQAYIPPNAAVALKPNLGWDILIPGAISAPLVVEGVIQVLRGYVSKIYLVESDQVVVDVEKAVRITGLDKLCAKYGVEWVNMSRGHFVRVQDDRRLILKDVYIPEILTQTELITLPLMKTHNKSVITGAIKNQWGCLQTLRHQFHLVLSQALVDVNTIVQPRFAVMDATVGLEGDGPKAGIPKEMGLVLAGGDVVALDAVAARIMGFDPARIEHLRLCAAHRLGTNNMDAIEVVGLDVQEVQARFQPARHNLISFSEIVLRKSFIRRLIFQTPLFGLMCWGTRLYYDVWDFAIGRRLRNNVFRSSQYTAQWKNSE